MYRTLLLPPMSPDAIRSAVSQVYDHYERNSPRPLQVERIARKRKRAEKRLTEEQGKPRLLKQHVWWTATRYRLDQTIAAQDESLDAKTPYKETLCNTGDASRGEFISVPISAIRDTWL
jgi:hypothetical protein